MMAAVNRRRTSTRCSLRRVLCRPGSLGCAGTRGRLGGYRRAGLRTLAGRIALELFDQPIQPIEVVPQSLLGIVHGMPEDSNRASIAACDDRLEKLQVEISLAQWEHLAALSLAVTHHPVEI